MNIMKHGFLEPQNVTVKYKGVDIDGGKITKNGTFEADNQSWNTPGGFALYMVRKKFGHVKQVYGYSSVYINDIKLDNYRQKYIKYLQELRKNVLLSIVLKDKNNISSKEVVERKSYFTPLQVIKNLSIFNSEIKQDIRNPNTWKKKGNSYYYNGDKYFTIKQSNIPGAGYGLFADREFNVKKTSDKEIRKDTEFYYEGIPISYEENGITYITEQFKERNNVNENTTIYLEDYENWQRSPDGAYIMTIIKNKKELTIDGNYGCFNGTKFINDSKCLGKGNLELNQAGGFYIIKNIGIGDELLFQYSERNSYWKNRINYKIDFNNTIRRIPKKEKEKLTKNNKLNIFPQFPSSDNNIITEGTFVQAPWVDDRLNYPGKYNGYVTEVYSNKRKCKVLFDDNESCDVEFKEIAISKRICPYCNSCTFNNYNEYQEHTLSCNPCFNESC